MFEKVLKGFQTISLSYLAQTAVVGHGLIKITANVPAVGKTQVDSLHQLSVRANTFKESDQLQLEKHYEID